MCGFLKPDVPKVETPARAAAAPKATTEAKVKTTADTGASSILFGKSTKKTGRSSVPGLNL